MASFETSLYDENLKPRADFGLADLLGVSKAGDVIGTNGNAYYGAHRTRGHSTPSSKASATPTGLPARRIASRSSPCRIPCSPSFPASCAIRRSWPTRRSRTPTSRQSCCANPAPAALACFPGDIERTYWLTGHGDLLRLLHNTIRWVTHDERIVHVEGEGLIEMFCWETAPGYAIHLLNYTNPNAQHGWMQSVNPLGPQTVSMKLPQGCSVKSVELLQAGQHCALSAWKARRCNSPYRASKTTR